MPRWIVFYVHPQQQTGTPGRSCTLVESPTDYNPDDPWASLAWEADDAGAAISQAALKVREGGDFLVTNVDTLVVAEGVELQMQAILSGIRSAGVPRTSGIDHP